MLRAKQFIARYFDMTLHTIFSGENVGIVGEKGESMRGERRGVNRLQNYRGLLVALLKNRGLFW